jgi:hypothetical protein
MKNRTNIIIELVVLLALCIAVTLVISKNVGEETAESLGITPTYTDENGVTVWAFDEDMNELLEENLQAPVREKYGIIEPDDAFSRCSSYVSTSLSGATMEIYKDGFYYGIMTISIGCETFEDYNFRVDSMGTLFEIEDATGSYVSVEEWVKTE